MPTISGRAPAKVNLGLKILSRRSDGYHELRTIYQTISLADRLTVSYRPSRSIRVTLTCSDPQLAGSKNLAARAATALLRAGRWKGRVAIELEKKIPVEAGLGGGSSDAAAVLLGLRQLLKPPPPLPLLFEIAAGLGSDVPFFLLGGTAIGVGRGEEVYPLPDRRSQWLLLLAPERRMPTVEAYRELSRARRSLTVAAERNIIKGFWSGVSASEDRETEDPAGAPPNFFENDFEDIVFRRYPELKYWKNRLVHVGASRAMLSGSGSALFGVFSDRKQALEARGLVGEFPGKLYLARTLSRKSYRSLWTQ